jgi:tripeptide aminopeptidase
LASVPFSSPLAAELADGLVDRFLRYVRVDTQSEEGATTTPSTAKQLDLSRMLEAELREIGLEDVEMSEHGYVYATLPGTPGAPVIGLVAHVDTSPESPGANVSPLIHESYDGKPIVLPGDPSQVLDPAQEPALAARLGHDIITSDGTTLLGADDKAGVAEIMTAVAYLREVAPEPRATVRVGFTVDEEVGRGADHFDIEGFRAIAAYTLDGSGSGEIETESFSARQLKVIIGGNGEHPGTAKGKLVNAVKLAADFVAALPRDSLSPETTEHREGFVHPTRIAGGVEETTVTLIVRDHDDELLEQHTALVHRLAAEIEEREPRATVAIETWDQYRNMRRGIDPRPEIVTNAEEAIRRSGVQPEHAIIRGGTDGSRLTEMGLPTPNLFTGGQKYHSRREWASVQDMATAAAMVVELVKVWGERA